MFETVESVRQALDEQQYIATDEIATVLFLAESLGKPLLAEGPAGVGKTELSKAWAAATGRELVRLQCYEGLDESKALYEWEYAKQMLYTQLLRDKLANLLTDTRSLAEAADRLGQEEDVFFSDRFLLPRPLLRAISSDQPVVLLIDEIDRADAEFEAFLLEVLSDFQVSIPEIGTVIARHRPVVFLTSNNTRELSEALKRRCLYLHVDYPTMEREREIVLTKVDGIKDNLADQIARVVRSIRQLDLKKAPSVSETLDWARTLLLLNIETIDEQTAKDTLHILLKYQSDIAKATKELTVEGS